MLAYTLVLDEPERYKYGIKTSIYNTVEIPHQVRSEKHTKVIDLI